MGSLRFETVDESCLIKATTKEATCEWPDQVLDRALPRSTGRAVLARSSRMSKTSQ